MRVVLLLLVSAVDSACSTVTEYEQYSLLICYAGRSDWLIILRTLSIDGQRTFCGAGSSFNLCHQFNDFPHAGKVYTQCEVWVTLQMFISSLWESKVNINNPRNYSSVLSYVCPGDGKFSSIYRHVSHKGIIYECERTIYRLWILPRVRECWTNVILWQGKWPMVFRERRQVYNYEIIIIPKSHS